MNKERLKKVFFISLIIFIGLAMSITYFFVLYQKDSILQGISSITAVLRPFIIGAILAYIMKSTCNFYEKKLQDQFLKSKNRSQKRSKKLANICAVVMTYITWIAALSALLYIAIPQVYESVSKFVNDLINNVPTYAETVSNWVNKFIDDNPMFEPYIANTMSMLTEWVDTELLPSLRQLGGNILNMVLGLFTIIKDIAIGLVISAFFLMGRKVFARKSKLLMYCLFKEKTADAIIDEAKYADRMFGGFLEGKVIDSTIIGLIYYLALVLMDIPYPALIAVICGVTNIIPFFGPFIGAIPSGLIILMSSDHPIKVLYFLIFVCVIQFIDGNIIDPHIVGGNIKMSPFCVIFAVILFGGLWGFAGLLVGVPLFAVIYDIFRKLAIFFLKKRGKEHLIEEYLADFKADPPAKKPKKIGISVGKAKNTEAAASAQTKSTDLKSENDEAVDSDAEISPETDEK